MLQRSLALLSIGCALLLSTGCGTGKSAKKKNIAPSAGAEDVAFHVPQMRERLNLTWLDWPNEVEEALLGLPGVEAVEVDLKGDRLLVRFDPAKVTADNMLQTISDQGFSGEIVPRE